jgi:hypothetical protein
MLRLVVDTDVLRRARQPRHTDTWQLWHVWTVTIPRRAINGDLLWGTVLRRHDGDRWIYKRYIDDPKFS